MPPQVTILSVLNIAGPSRWRRPVRTAGPSSDRLAQSKHHKKQRLWCHNWINTRFNEPGIMNGQRALDEPPPCRWTCTYVSLVYIKSWGPQRKWDPWGIPMYFQSLSYYRTHLFLCSITTNCFQRILLIAFPPYPTYYRHTNSLRGEIVKDLDPASR